MLKLHLKLSAVPMVALLICYPIFPLYFHWIDHMADVPLLTRDIFWVHHFMIVLLLALQSLLLLRWTKLLTTPTPAGLAIAIGLLSFWGLRLLMQLFYYSPQHWLGKPFETVVHIILVLTVAYMTLVYGLAVRHQRLGLRTAA